MTEVWLRSNQRVLLLAMVPVALLGAFALLVIKPFWFWPGVICLAVATVLLAGLVWQIFRPRIAFRGETVLFYLKRGRPIEVPVKIVEAFFQGQGPAHLPGASRHQAKSVNLIARLSQRETDWQQRQVKAALGNWSEGYVTIRGTWCEPISGEVIRRLNRRLGEVSRAIQSVQESVASE